MTRVPSKTRLVKIAAPLTPHFTWLRSGRKSGRERTSATIESFSNRSITYSRRGIYRDQSVAPEVVIVVARIVFGQSICAKKERRPTCTKVLHVSGGARSIVLGVDLQSP
jgi:hypothetical protein